MSYRRLLATIACVAAVVVVSIFVATSPTCRTFTVHQNPFPSDTSEQAVQAYFSPDKSKSFKKLKSTPERVVFEVDGREYPVVRDSKGKWNIDAEALSTQCF